MASRARLIRKRPLADRLQEYLDPADWALWLGELLDDDWLETLQDNATSLGIGANALYIFAQAYGVSTKDEVDVFGDYDGRHNSGWFAWLCRALALLLVALSWIITANTLLKRRSYRLFEQGADYQPQTPSARRVRVESSPATRDSALSSLNDAILSFLPESASSRAHSQEGRDVWEISIWDPSQFGLRFCCLFSPIHLGIYMMFLPAHTMDPAPSVTYLKAMSLIVMFSGQAIFLATRLQRQYTDKGIISKEVFNEYDTKFVHPSLNHVVRDVGIQTPPSKLARTQSGSVMRDAAVGSSTPEIQTYRPHTIINRGFHISPNPEYVSQYDPDRQLREDETTRLSKNITTPAFSAATPIAWRTPTVIASATSSSSTALNPDFSSPLKPMTAQRQQVKARSPVRHSTGTSTGVGEGGSLGVYTHAASPLKRQGVRHIPNSKAPVDRLKASNTVKRVSLPAERTTAQIQVDRSRSRDAEPQSRGY